jgi:hypothetical protein
VDSEHVEVVSAETSIVAPPNGGATDDEANAEAESVEPSGAQAAQTDADESPRPASIAES